MKNLLIKINNFINTDMPASLLIMANVLIVIYQIYSGQHGSTFLIIGFIPGFACAFWTHEKTSTIFKWLAGVMLVLGVCGIFVMDNFQDGTTPLFLKWIYGYTGQLFGLIAASMIYANTSVTRKKE